MRILTIAISGMPGAGSSTVGKLLANELSMHHFSPGQLFKDISKGTVKEQHYYKLFKHLCDLKGLNIPEMSVKEDSKAVVSLWDSEFGRSKSFHEVLDRLQLELAKRKRIVIDGKLSLRMIPDADIKIWIRAELEERAKRIAEREKISVDEAKKNIVERESREREEWKRIYGFDYFDQEEDADIIVDSSTMSPQSIVEVILGHPAIRDEQ